MLLTLLCIWWLYLFAARTGIFVYANKIETYVVSPKKNNIFHFLFIYFEQITNLNNNITVKDATNKRSRCFFLFER